MSNRLPASLKKMFSVASAARKKAYVPYSGVQVGAAIRLTNGKIVGGCNVENSSYGGTICAERVAITKAVSDYGKIKIAELLVVTDSNPPWPPCGLCRQVMSEFVADGDVMVHATNLQGVIKSTRFKDILPDAFTPAYLKKA